MNLRPTPIPMLLTCTISTFTEPARPRTPAIGSSARRISLSSAGQSMASMRNMAPWGLRPFAVEGTAVATECGVQQVSGEAATGLAQQEAPGIDLATVAGVRHGFLGRGNCVPRRSRISYGSLSSMP